MEAISAPPDWRHPWRKPSTPHFVIMQKYEAARTAKETEAKRIASATATPDRLPGESDLEALKRLSNEREHKLYTPSTPFSLQMNGRHFQSLKLPVKMPRRRDFYTDGSVQYSYADQRDHGGAAWTTFVNGEWVGEGFALGWRERRYRDAFSYEAELEAIRIALLGAERFAHEVDIITIISDCKHAIHHVIHACKLPIPEYHQEHHELKKAIVATIRNFQRVGVLVKFESVKGHTAPSSEHYRAEGNRVADKMAKEASEVGKRNGLRYGEWWGELCEQPEGQREGDGTDPLYFIDWWGDEVEGGGVLEDVSDLAGKRVRYSGLTGKRIRYNLDAYSDSE
jgi:hypothetical protein